MWPLPPAVDTVCGKKAPRALEAQSASPGQHLTQEHEERGGQGLGEQVLDASSPAALQACDRGQELGGCGCSGRLGSHTPPPPTHTSIWYSALLSSELRVPESSSARAPGPTPPRSAAPVIALGEAWVWLCVATELQHSQPRILSTWVKNGARRGSEGQTLGLCSALLQAWEAIEQAIIATAVGCSPSIAARALVVYLAPCMGPAANARASFSAICCLAPLHAISGSHRRGRKGSGLLQAPFHFRLPPSSEPRASTSRLTGAYQPSLKARASARVHPAPAPPPPPLPPAP